MRDAIGYLSLLDDPNVKSFFAVVRSGEGTSDSGGYSRHFGGDQFDSFADHPRKVITKKLGGKSISSTAAGAYQHLARTWDECASALGLADFSPKNQDLAALFLIDRRKALEDVLAGRIERAIAKCNREWASLPGSPYGQPVKTMEQALATYRAHGGSLSMSEKHAQISDELSYAEPVTAHIQPIASALSQEQPMPAPLIPILAAVLPSLIRSIPDFGKLFSSGSEVSERNVKAVEMAVGIVQEAVGARNAQEAAEIVASDPAQAEAAAEALQARWYELQPPPVSVEAARKADVAFVAAGSNPLSSPAFLISLVLLVMPMMLLGDVFFFHPGAYDGPLRTQIVTGVLMVIAIVGGYWLGSSFGSAKKTDLMGR
jgi:muramidase (phage lysozyme)